MYNSLFNFYLTHGYKDGCQLTIFMKDLDLGTDNLFNSHVRGYFTKRTKRSNGLS